MDLLKRLLEHKPEQRIPFDQFFSHPFLDSAGDAESAAKCESRARRFIERARICESSGDIEEAFRLYCHALTHLMSALRRKSISLDCH